MPWAGELTIFLFIWVIFLGAAITLSKGLHIGVDIFTSILKKSNKRLIYIFTNILIIVFIQIRRLVTLLNLATTMNGLGC